MKQIDLSNFEAKKYSQNGEDGIIVTLLNTVKNLDKSYLEIGVETGAECNTRILWNDYGFTGVMIDGKYENKQINLFKHFLTKENVLSVINSYNISKNIDIFSIDIDLNDFYITKEILKEYRPKIIVCEYNSFFNPDEDKIVKYNANEIWDGTNYLNASLLSWYKLFSIYNYSLVYCEKSGVNCFWIRNDLIPGDLIFKNMNNLKSLYKRRDWNTPDTKNRSYVSFQEAVDI